MGMGLVILADQESWSPSTLPFSMVELPAAPDMVPVSDEPCACTVRSEVCSPMGVLITRLQVSVDGHIHIFRLGGERGRWRRGRRLGELHEGLEGVVGDLHHVGGAAALALGGGALEGYAHGLGRIKGPGAAQAVGIGAHPLAIILGRGEEAGVDHEQEEAAVADSPRVGRRAAHHAEQLDHHGEA